MNNNVNNGGYNQVPQGMPYQGQPMPQAPIPQVPVQPVAPMPVAPQPVTMPQPVATTQAQEPQAPTPQVAQAMPTPQVAAPVTTEVVEPVPEIDLNPTPQQDAVQPSVVEDLPTEESATGDDITFDYNALYGIQSEDIKDINVEEEKKPVFTEQNIVIDDRYTKERVVDDVTPEFNMDDLAGTNKNQGQQLTSKILDEKQQDKADTRRRILFIGVLTILIIVFMTLILPLFV